MRACFSSGGPKYCTEKGWQSRGRSRRVQPGLTPGEAYIGTVALDTSLPPGLSPPSCVLSKVASSSPRWAAPRRLFDVRVLLGTPLGRSRVGGDEGAEGGCLMGLFWRHFCFRYLLDSAPLALRSQSLSRSLSGRKYRSVAVAGEGDGAGGRGKWAKRRPCSLFPGPALPTRPGFLGSRQPQPLLSLSSADASVRSKG